MNRSLGILGGGQLAMFMCEAAGKLGIETWVLSPDPDAPAKKVCDEFILAAYDDAEALAKLAEHCEVITLDNEHIPENTLLDLAASVTVFPQATVMSRLRDRLSQRGLLSQLHVPQVRFWSIDKAPSLRAAARAASFPAVLKRRHGGYDGYGQIKVESSDQLNEAWHHLDQAACVLEAWVAEAREFSIVGVRGNDGQFKLYPPIENWHARGQLLRSDMPAQLLPKLKKEAEHIWKRIAENLNYQGVLSVEFFISNTDQLLVNEIAPRVHNSGHITQWVSPHCQFMAHVRAVMNLPLPDIKPLRDGSMWNLYPDHGMHDPAVAASYERVIGGRILLYGKTARPQRKMGHWLAGAEQRHEVESVLASRKRQ